MRRNDPPQKKTKQNKKLNEPKKTGKYANEMGKI